MDWHFWAAAVAGLVVASLADWIFAGVLFHDRYLRHPEVWRTPGQNIRGIIVAQALTIPTVLGTIALLELTGSATIGPALIVATLVWGVAAAPATIVNGVFIKLDPAVVAAHTIGWLVKLLGVAAVAIAIIHGLGH
jgi:hypothetical protein